jgi:hypothetical protein
LTAAGGAAPTHGGEVAGAGVGAGSRGSKVTTVGQDQRDGPDKLAGRVPAMRLRPGARERRRESSRWVGVTLARNLGRGDGESSVLRLGLAPAREGECYRPTQGPGRGQFGRILRGTRQIGANELRQGQIG